MARRRTALVGVLAVGLVLATSCGGEDAGTVEATPDQRAVCDGMQQVADRLAAGESLAALTGLDDLVGAVAATDDAELAEAGGSFLEAISRPVDYESMTIEESAAMGDQVLAEATGGLEALGDRCAAVGLPIEVDQTAATVSGR